MGSILRIHSSSQCHGFSWKEIWDCNSKTIVRYVVIWFLLFLYIKITKFSYYERLDFIFEYYILHTEQSTTSNEPGLVNTARRLFDVTYRINVGIISTAGQKFNDLTDKKNWVGSYVCAIGSLNIQFMIWPLYDM